MVLTATLVIGLRTYWKRNLERDNRKMKAFLDAMEKKGILEKEEAKVFCSGCGKEISKEEHNKFYGYCEECFTELEITDLDLDEEGF